MIDRVLIQALSAFAFWYGLFILGKGAPPGIRFGLALVSFVAILVGWALGFAVALYFQVGR